MRRNRRKKRKGNLRDWREEGLGLGVEGREGEKERRVKRREERTEGRRTDLLSYWRGQSHEKLREGKRKTEKKGGGTHRKGGEKREWKLDEEKEAAK
jgi:hypothetical protein